MNTSNTLDLSTNARPRSIRSRITACVAAALITSSLAAGVLTAPADAATSTGNIGQFTDAPCGWYSVRNGNMGAYDYKVTSVGLPWVTGTTKTKQTVWLFVSFHTTSGVYRSGWFRTTAVAGVWTKSWTSNLYGTSGWTSLQDALGESGYLNGAPQVVVSLEMSWMTGNVVTGTVQELAYSANSIYNHNICNAGANL